MAWDVIESARSGTGGDGIESAISDWESSVSPSSIDQVDTQQVGSNRVAITIIYTA